VAVSRVVDRVGQVLGGRYRLIAPIGSGASASVYLADDVTLKRRVAVKILHDALADDAAFLRRFRAEAQAAAALNHPHIMAVYDWGHGDVPFLVTEYLGGGSLRHVLDRGRTLSVSQTLLVGLEAARGLDYAHRRGFVHRDIKPANLLFDEDGRLRIADFGLARALAEAAWTEPMGAVLGTARYASPEQARGETLDGRSDIYSMGVIFYEMLTARLPFPRCKPMEYISHHINTPPIPVTERRPELNLPKELDPIMAKALEKTRENRYASAKDFAEALQAVIPRAAQSGAMHAIPSAARGESTQSQRISSTAPPVEREPARGGKGLVVALLVVIAVLLIAVILLLASSEADDPAVVPLQPPGQTGPPDQPPPGQGAGGSGS
jgi:serine/threonine-protein kinase